MSVSSVYGKAFQAAREAVGPQNHPASTLYVVATPIGNLADITLRALYVIERANTLACEDTRHTQQLLRAYGLDRNSSQLLAVHQHNEAEAAAQVIARLAQGERVAYVSDAGTPAISDPGAYGRQERHAHQIRDLLHHHGGFHGIGRTWRFH